jgi:hypothetical protein
METALHDKLDHEITRRQDFVRALLFSWSMENQSRLSDRDREKIAKLKAEKDELTEELKRREGES